MILSPAGKNSFLSIYAYALIKRGTTIAPFAISSAGQILLDPIIHKEWSSIL